MKGPELKSVDHRDTEGHRAEKSWGGSGQTKRVPGLLPCQSFIRVETVKKRGPVNLFVSAQVGTKFAWSVSAKGRQPILKDDREVIQRLSPFGNWQRPLLGRLVNRHVHQLQR